MFSHNHIIPYLSVPRPVIRQNPYLTILLGDLEANCIGIFKSALFTKNNNNIYKNDMGTSTTKFNGHALGMD